MSQISEITGKPVYFYLRKLPRMTGSGAEIRFYTNIRTYLDLGFTVEIVYIADNAGGRQGDLSQIGLDAEFTRIKAKPIQPSYWQRLVYKAGFAVNDALDVAFPLRQQIHEIMLRNEVKNRGAIHHFEYLDMASASIGSNLNTVWSCHDATVARHRKIFAMRAVIGKTKTKSEANLRLKYLALAEQQVTASCKLVLTIAKHETDEMRSRLGADKIELLPMSWPDESIVTRRREWCDGQTLRLLHVGSLGGMVGYHSLKFLLGEVFPLLPDHTREGIELLVIGRDHGSPYSAEIHQLAAGNPRIKFFGFVDDIKPFYGETDLQVVATNYATGLRTRIIESFVFGLPVLSLKESAEGVLGLNPPQNILIAEDAQDYAEQLVMAAETPEKLSDIAVNARQTYETYYGRNVASQNLADYLAKYLQQR